MKTILSTFRLDATPVALAAAGAAATDGCIGLAKQLGAALTPAWAGSPALVAECYRRAFDAASSLTIGVEEELILLDPESLLPVNAVDRVLPRFAGDDRITCELRQPQLELVVPPCRSASDVRSQLAAARALVVRELDGELRVAAVGAHPTSTESIAITGRDRYLGIAADSPWVTLRGIPCGLHIHVAVDGAERALAVYNALRSYLPEISALAANSPFLEGVDTGLASTRAKLNEALARSGIPPSFSSWDELAAFVAWAARGRLFPDPSYLWWDLRPHPVHGTLEIRIADAQTKVADAGALAAFCQALVASLGARYDAGEPLPVHDAVRIRENAWRAIRYGVDGELVDLETGEPEPARSRIGRLLAELEPFAEELASRDELLRMWTLLAANGADRQRGVVTLEGLDGLLRWLADETEAPTPASTSLVGQG